ncbi:hypothetical protein B0H17DRAFT_1144861 [Mycena rosella]|uniref:Uncharacterized protein n=1 Tax=Mycena rosella TaxID=1033263 RepID=A0AAD7CSD6_MYCRO|nr:hypothetical protein B0H17DRAFT_1144861 [Mycena rosella]
MIKVRNVRITAPVILCYSKIPDLDQVRARGGKREHAEEEKRAAGRSRSCCFAERPRKLMAMVARERQRSGLRERELGEEAGHGKKFERAKYELGSGTRKYAKLLQRKRGKALRPITTFLEIKVWASFLLTLLALASSDPWRLLRVMLLDAAWPRLDLRPFPTHKDVDQERLAQPGEAGSRWAHRHGVDALGVH